MGEKLWRAKTGIRKSSIKKGGVDKKKKKKDPKTKENEAMATNGAELKKWMRKNDVKDPEQLKDIEQNSFDEIVRKVRVDRFSQLKDQKARQRADKLLIKFEKLWRKASGIKSTSIKK